MKLLDDIKQFTDYCDDFYNIKTGIYPIATRKEIETAIEFYFLNQKDGVIIEFDTIDRERVRGIIGK